MDLRDACVSVQSLNEVFATEYHAALLRFLRKFPGASLAEAEHRLFQALVRVSALKRTRRDDCGDPEGSDAQSCNGAARRSESTERREWPSLQFLVTESARAASVDNESSASAGPVPESESDSAALRESTNSESARGASAPECVGDAALFRTRLDEARQRGTVRYRDACRAVRLEAVLWEATHHWPEQEAKAKAVEEMVDCLRSLYEPTPPPPIAAKDLPSLITAAPFPEAELPCSSPVAQKDSDQSDSREDRESDAGSMMIRPTEPPAVVVTAARDPMPSDGEREAKRDKMPLPPNNQRRPWPARLGDEVPEVSDQARLFLAHHTKLMDPEELVKKMQLAGHTTYGYLPDSVLRARSRSRSGGKSAHRSFLRPKKGSRKGRKKAASKKKKRDAEFYGKKRSLGWEGQSVSPNEWSYDDYSGSYAPSKRPRLSLVANSSIALPGVVLTADSTSVTPQPLPDCDDD